MTLLKAWIAEKLNYSLKECIIYCGLQDIMDEETTIDEMLDSLGSTIADLKDKHDNVSVKVCELVPSLKTDELAEKISRYNSKLTEWCNNNDIVVIKTDKYFRLGTGDIDINCYENSDNFDYDILSRIGATRLLDAISSVCQSNFVCANWRDIKQRSLKVNNNRSRSSVSNDDRGRNYITKFQVIDRRKPAPQNERYHSNRNVYNGRGLDGSHLNFNEHNYGRVNRSQTNSNVQFSQNHHHTVYRNQRGCFNCGEFNHRQSNCRYDHKIKCNICHEYGHKSRFCDRNKY